MDASSAALLRDLPEMPEPRAAERGLRILMPSYRSHPYTGGQGVYMRHISKALSDLGHQVAVVSGPPYPELDARVRLIRLPSLDLYARPKGWAGVPALPPEAKGAIDLKEWLIHISGGFGEPYTFGQRMARWLKGHAHEFDIVFDNQTLSYGLLAARAMGLPVTGIIHHPITLDRSIAIDHAESLSLRLLIRRWYSFLRMQKRVVRELGTLVTGSESAKRDFARDFGVPPAKMRVVPHGVDIGTFRPIPGMTRKTNRLIATTSADVPLKGLVYLVRALALLVPDYPDLELVVIGKLREGPTERMLRELNLIARVRFVTGVSDAEINRLYAEATLAVCPSVYEGFGFPAAEAMAAGVSLVSSMGGSLPEVVGDAGVLVPAKDPAALASAVAMLLDNPALRDELGAKGRARAIERFQWSRAAKKTAMVCREVIGHAHDRSRRARA